MPRLRAPPHRLAAPAGATGLARVAVLDRVDAVEPPACGGCGGDPAGVPGAVASNVQVFDLSASSVSVTEYLVTTPSAIPPSA